MLKILSQQSKETKQISNAVFFTQSALFAGMGAAKSTLVGLKEATTFLQVGIDIFKALDIFFHIQSIIDWSKRKVKVKSEKHLQKLNIANSSFGAAISIYRGVKVVNFFGKFAALSKAFGYVRVFPLSSCAATLEITKASISIAISAITLKALNKSQAKEKDKKVLWAQTIDAKFASAKIARIQAKMFGLKGQEYDKLAEKKHSWERLLTKLQTNTLTAEDQKALDTLKTKKIEKHELKLKNLGKEKDREKINLLLQSIIITFWVSMIIFTALAIVTTPIPLIVIGVVGMMLSSSSAVLHLHKTYVNPPKPASVNLNF